MIDQIQRISPGLTIDTANPKQIGPDNIRIWSQFSNNLKTAKIRQTGSGRY